jgi:hypothetical protein
MHFIKRKSLETGQKSGSRKCVDMENCSHSHLLEPRFRMTFWTTSRIANITGQSLPIFAPLLTIDALWTDLHMVHEDRSLMSYDSFYCSFRTAQAPKILAGSGALSF